MIRHTQSLSITQALREIPQALTDGFPHVAIDSDLSLFPDGYSTWHWHESFEFCVVAAGEMRLDTQRGGLLLRPGEGYFVNANVLHSNRALPDSGPVRLHVQQFDARLIGGGERTARRYVEPIERCAALDALPLRPDEPNQRALMEALSRSFDICEADASGWELRVSELLTNAWGLLFELAAPTLREAAPSSRDDAPRIKRMLSYLHAHYAEPVAVADIAAAAGLGERECYRCFRQALGVSPIPYLTRLRVDAAARLLRSTDHSITEIAAECGFASPAYFCSVFRRLTGAAPSAFRKRLEGGEIE